MNSYPVISAVSVPEVSSIFGVLRPDPYDRGAFARGPRQNPKVSSSATSTPYSAFKGSAGGSLARRKWLTSSTSKFESALAGTTTRPSAPNGWQSQVLPSLLAIDDEMLIDDQLPTKIINGITWSLLIDGEKAGGQLLRFFFENKLTAAKALAICQAIGRVTEGTAKIHVLNVLSSLLGHSLPYVRDAAVVGLALIDDTRALPALRAAHAQETSRLLRETMAAVISQL